MTEPYASSPNYGDVAFRNQDVASEETIRSNYSDGIGPADFYGLDQQYVDGRVLYRCPEDPDIIFKAKYGADAARDMYNQVVNQEMVEEFDQQYLEKLMDSVESPLDEL